MSAVLVDTHIALWALGDSARLAVEERSLLIDPSIDRCLSPVSVWEAAIKRQAGRLRAPRHLSAVLAAEFRMLDISAFLLEAAAALPPHHGDPFDRVLVAHALQTISACSQGTPRSPTTACDSRRERPSRHTGAPRRPDPLFVALAERRARLRGHGLLEPELRD